MRIHADQNGNNDSSSIELEKIITTCVWGPFLQYSSTGTCSSCARQLTLPSQSPVTSRV